MAKIAGFHPLCPLAQRIGYGILAPTDLVLTYDQFLDLNRTGAIDEF